MRNRLLPRLEPLEARDAPACSSSVVNGVLRANCDNNPNSVTLDFMGNVTLLNGVAFSTASFSSILLNTGAAADTVRILGVPADRPTTADGGGGLDTVLLGAGGTLQRILAPVWVQNLPSYTAVILDSSADQQAGNVTLDVVTLGGFPHGLVTGLAPAEIAYRAADVLNVTLLAGAGNSTFVIRDTPQNIQNPVTTLNAGAGPDFIHVQGTTGALVVHAGTGDDLIRLGSVANSLTPLRGRVAALGQEGRDTLQVYDQGSFAGQSYHLVSTTIMRSGGVMLSHDVPEQMDFQVGDVEPCDPPPCEETPILVIPPEPEPPCACIWNFLLSSRGDLFSLSRLPQNLHVQLDGRGGSDFLRLPDQSNRVQITGLDRGHIGLPAGPSRGQGSLTFTALENLIGGSADDTFAFDDGQGLSGVLDGGFGSDLLDYTGYTTGVYADLFNRAASNIGGQVRGIEHLVGGQGDDLLIGDDGDNILVGGAGNDYLIGFGGRDLLIGGFGQDWLYGGSGEDILIDGVTIYDGDPVSLRELHRQWLRPDLGNYWERVYYLSCVSFLLTSETVQSDDLPDELYGGEDLDWFWGLDGYDLFDRDPKQEVLNSPC